MDELVIERRLTGIEERSKSNTHRIDDIEKRQDSLDKLASSVQVLATRQETVETDIKEIKVDVKALTEKPAKRWENFVWEVIRLVVAALIGFGIARL